MSVSVMKTEEESKPPTSSQKDHPPAVSMTPDAVSDLAGTEKILQIDPTEEQIQTLRHVLADIPLTVWLVASTGAAQRFEYWGVSIPWQNYLQNTAGNPLLPGVLGLGQTKATIINSAFLLFSYLTPSFIAVVSDSWLGRYKTLIISHGLLLIGCTVLFCTSLPVVQDTSGISGFVIGAAIVSIAQGGTKTVVYPFLGDQLSDIKHRLVKTEKGELVVVDRAMTIQYIFNVYYWMINIAGLSSLATTLLEKHVGFWAAFLLPTTFLIVSIAPLIFWNRILVKQPPQSNLLPLATRVVALAARSRFQLSATFPAYQYTHFKRTVPWTSNFVIEIKKAVRASRVIFSFAIFWLCYNQILNNIISQAGQMNSHGLSNDTLQTMNPIACIILGPIIQKGLFPLLSHYRIPFGPISRMTVAFVSIALGMGYAAILQQLIYSRGPCFSQPLDCPAALGRDKSAEGQASKLVRHPNDISVWLQVPLHFILGIGEILGTVSLSEYSYEQAPASMKALLQSFDYLSAAIAAALGMALGPVAKNPWLVRLYGSLAGAMFLSSCLFWIVFRRYDDDAEVGSDAVDTDNVCPDHLQNDTGSDVTGAA